MASIVTIPGVVGLSAALAARGSVLSDVTVNAAWLAGTWTADAATNVLTSTVAHGLAVGALVSFGAGTGVIPAGILAAPDYYYVESVPTATTLTVKYTRAGAAVDITANGTAGWTIRSATVSAPPIDIDTVAYPDLDLYAILRMPSRLSDGSSYPKIQFSPSACRVFLNDAGANATSQNALLYGSIATKKHVSLVARLSLRRLSTALAAIQVNIVGLQSDAIDLSSSTPYTRVLSGSVTGSDITSLVLCEAYSSTQVLNGARYILVRR